MHHAKKPQARILAIGLSGLAVSLLLIGGGVAIFLRARQPSFRASSTQGQSETVAAIVDAMNRSDAEGVMKYIDVEAVFNNLVRHITEAGLKKPLTDEEFKTLTANNATFLPQMKAALVHGVTTQADKDAATSGSVMAALVHLSEGKIEQRGDGRFAVVFADDSSLEFAREDGGWRAVNYIGIDARLEEYRKIANDDIRAGMGAQAKKQAGATGTDAPGTPAGR